MIQGVILKELEESSTFSVKREELIRGLPPYILNINIQT